jgi:NADPH2 dehydrogenase
MASETADSKGFVTDKTLTHYSRLSRSGAGLMMVEYTYVHSSGRSEAHQLGITTDDHVPGLTIIAELFRKAGAVAGIQLTHCGGKSDYKLTSGELIGASAVSVPVKDNVLEIPRSMTLEEIVQLKKWFLQAAYRAVAAGFGLIELHSAHGYGLNQWLSSVTNQRSDEYGGSLRNRARLLLEIIVQIRSAFPNILLAVRLPGQDLMENGLSVQNMIEVSLWLQEAGLDILDVSSGLGGWRRPKERRGEGYLIPEASRIQSEVSIPVIGVGGIETPEYMDKVIAERKVSLTAVGRAILIDPVKFNERIFLKGVNHDQKSNSYIYRRNLDSCAVL